MRALVLVLLFVAPIALADGSTDTRDVVANHVYPTKCPSYSTPATVACFDAPANATSALIVAAPDVGDAQPRMLVWAYDDRNLTGTFWMCDDGAVPVRGDARLVVTLHADECARWPQIIEKGTLSVTWT